jgi:hypothetical protein
MHRRVVVAQAHFVFGGKRPAAEDPPTAALTTAFVKAVKGRQNFIAKHWRGELPLWVSYWIIGIATGLVAFLDRLSPERELCGILGDEVDQAAW